MTNLHPLFQKLLRPYAPPEKESLRADQLEAIQNLISDTEYCLFLEPDSGKALVNNRLPEINAACATFQTKGTKQP